jgi:methyltransferase (TIGR00027 family)
MTKQSTDQAVQATGWLTAAARARECEREDAYLVDQYAWPLVTGDAAAQLTEMISMGISVECVVVRGRLGDEIIRSAAARGVRQAVGLGAGSDTRPYRLDLPGGFRFFELDMPGQIITKHGRLAEVGFVPVHQTLSVEGDLREDFGAGLLAAGFAPDEPCVWFAEGLLPYLEPAHVRALIDQIGALSAAGSEFFFDVLHERYGSRLAHRRVTDHMRGQGVEISMSHAEGPMQCLAAHGWTAVSYEDADLLAGACGLLPPVPPRLCTDPQVVRYVHAVNGR